MSFELDHVVVVGASLAGLRACETLRSEGYAGAITAIGAESHLPYDRPPLSKKLLAGEWEPDRIHLRKPDDMASIGVTWRLGVPATGLDLDARSVHLADGQEVAFDGLIVATGAGPRRLPGQPDAAGVHVLRTLDDAMALRAELVEGARVVVVGAGFIGLEVAATARAAGCSVVVLEGLAAPLVRGLGAEMGWAVAGVHQRHDVQVRCGVQVAAIEVDGARVRGVRLGDGEVVRADVVVVGIGVSPATAWVEGSGLEVRDGVVADATLRTTVPGVYAAGDLLRWPNARFDEEMRVEHWTNAAEQGAAAARSLLAEAAGAERPAYAPVPFFWSDQFEARVQFLGRAGADDEVAVVAGSAGEGKLLALYGRDGRLRGALGVSMPRLVMPYRALLARGATWDEALEHAASASV